MEYTNFFPVNKFSLGYKYFCYFDVKDYLADALFLRHKVRVKYKLEFLKQGTNYLAVLCKVHKKDVEEFVNALEELKTKMLLLGHTNYPEFCAEINQKMLGVEERI